MAFPMRDSNMWRAAWLKCFRVKPPQFTPADQMDHLTSVHVPELVQLGLASVLGVALFILGSEVTAHVSGPSSCLSVIVAASSAALAGLCFAELRSRWPRLVGPAYEYVYSSSGELAAWCAASASILLSVALIAAMGRSISASLDAMLNFRIQNTTLTHLHHIPGLGSTPDLLAAFVVMVMTVVTSLGQRQPRLLLSLANIVVMVITLFALVVGLFHIHFNLWAESGDFFPRGLQGTLEGAAVFFYAFTSFEVIITRSDPMARNGRRPMIATLCSYVIIAFFLIGVCSITGLLVARQQLSTEATWAESFMEAGLPWMRFMIGIPAIPVFAIRLWTAFTDSTSAMSILASDGLLFNFMQWKNRDDSTPMMAAIVTGLISIVFAIIISLTDLLEIIALACLVIYTITTFSLIAVRYKPLKTFKSNATTRRRRRRVNKSQTSNNNSNRGPSQLNKYGATEKDSPSLVTLSTDSNTNELENTSVDEDTEPRVSVQYPDPDYEVHATIPSTDLTRVGRQHTTITEYRDYPTPSLEEEDTVEIVELSSESDIDDAVEDYKDQVREYQLNSCGLPYGQLTLPDVSSQSKALRGSMVYFVTFFCLSLLLSHGGDQVRGGSIPVIIVMFILLISLGLSTLAVGRQPQNLLELDDLAINVPFVPWLPLMSLTLNAHLMARLSAHCWIECSIWWFTGMLIYIMYGAKNSKAEPTYSILPDEHSELLTATSAGNETMTSSPSVNPASNDDYIPSCDMEDTELVVLDTIDDELLDP